MRRLSNNIASSCVSQLPIPIPTVEAADYPEQGLKNSQEGLNIGRGGCVYNLDIRKSLQPRQLMSCLVSKRYTPFSDGEMPVTRQSMLEDLYRLWPAINLVAQVIPIFKLNYKS